MGTHTNCPIMKQLLIRMILLSNFYFFVHGQADGNPHDWDRIRRCDQQDYDPPCGPCEGVGGIPTGSTNNQITLTTCSIVGAPHDLPTPHPVVWGTQWTLPIAYEILIGQKNDPFCFQTFPGPNSVGELCYRKQTGSKYYDMVDNRAFREDLELETPVGNMTSIVIHQGKYFWVVNHLPWYAGGVHQCVCTDIKEGGAGDAVYYPVQYNWVDKLQYVGREIIGVEYINIERELDHWAFGPHHLWSEPDTGNIIRMWQPFNGLQVYPGGVPQGTVDPRLFEDIPPELCKAGGAIWRIGCDDEGYPIPDEKKRELREKRPKDAIRGKDLKRAEEKVPRGHYKGVDFGEMSDILNGWLNSSTHTKPCMDWNVQELQQLQALFYLARESQFDDIYLKSEDNRRMRHNLLTDLTNNWAGLNDIAAGHADYRMKNVRRDGHCHEAVMWYVHHISEDMKHVFKEAKIPVPLLSPARHAVCDQELDESGHKICGAYKEQVTCASCHSNELPPSL